MLRDARSRSRGVFLSIPKPSARLGSVPGREGHLFFAVGITGLCDPRPYNVPLKRSWDGGQSWQDLPKIQKNLGNRLRQGRAREDLSQHLHGRSCGLRPRAGTLPLNREGSFLAEAGTPPRRQYRRNPGDLRRHEGVRRIYYGFSGSGPGYAVAPG